MGKCECVFITGHTSLHSDAVCACQGVCVWMLGCTCECGHTCLHSDAVYVQGYLHAYAYLAAFRMTVLADNSNRRR